MCRNFKKKLHKLQLPKIDRKTFKTTHLVYTANFSDQKGKMLDTTYWWKKRWKKKAKLDAEEKWQREKKFLY